MTPNWRKQHIEEALKKAEALVAATNGDKSICSCFDISPFHENWDGNTTNEIKEGVRIYVNTWIIPELKKALQQKQYSHNP